jgi:hypothetical protein
VCRTRPAVVDVVNYELVIGIDLKYVTCQQNSVAAVSKYSTEHPLLVNFLTNQQISTPSLLCYIWYHCISIYNHAESVKAKYMYFLSCVAFKITSKMMIQSIKSMLCSFYPDAIHLILPFMPANQTYTGKRQYLYTWMRM